jgi:hypothetical protein
LQSLWNKIKLTGTTHFPTAEAIFSAIKIKKTDFHLAQLNRLVDEGFLAFSPTEGYRLILQK